MVGSQPEADSQHSSDKGERYEEENVHQVYERIAPHFSSTRFKPWPLVEKFLKEQPDGSIGLDVGCGNGKYLSVNKNIFIVGSDRSSGLARFASQHQPHSAILADTLSLPHPFFAFDFVISIAVIHHLSTAERRIQAVRSILSMLRKSITGSSDAGGKALFYVWALEQKNSRRGWDRGDDQDVMVPWVMKSDAQGASEDNTKTYHRYYHLYQQGELEHDILLAGGVLIDSGYEKDNWWAIATCSPAMAP